MHALLICIGLYYIVESAFEERDLINQAAAFIMVGGVGLIMSLTTTDIGKSLRGAIREEGKHRRKEHRQTLKEHRKTRQAIHELGEGIMNAIHEEGRQTRESIDALGRQTRESIDALGQRMEERDARMDKRLDRMSATIETMSRDNRDFFRQMLEAQNRILERPS